MNPKYHNKVIRTFEAVKMTSYKNLSITFPIVNKGGGIYIQSTDPKVFDWVHEEIKTRFTKVKVRDEVMDYKGNYISAKFDNLARHDFRIGTQIFQSAMDKGWQPYQFYYNSYLFLDSTTHTYLLRKEFNSI